MAKVPSYSCYGRHYIGLEGKNHTFDECFNFFYSNLTSMGKGYKPFERDLVPLWLKIPAAQPGENFDEHKEVWAGFFISRIYCMALECLSGTVGVAVNITMQHNLHANAV